MVGFFAVDFGWRERAGVLLGELVTSGVVEDYGAVGAGDFDFETRGCESDEFGIVSVEREVGLRPGFFDDEIVVALRDVALDGVDDVDDGVRADLESKEAGLENEHYAIGLLVHRGYGIERHPLCL